MCQSSKSTLSLAEKTGLGAITIAILIYNIAPVLTVFILLSYLLICLIAPFLPRFSFFLPIISSGIGRGGAVALTFDDGPTPASTPIILQFLKKYKLQATFFVIGSKAADHPQLIRDILDQGHTIANHSFQHDSFLMLRSYNKLKEDIEKTQEILQGFGIKPHVFRPPVGIISPRLGKVLDEIGLIVVNFSCRIFDGGNKRIDNLAERVMARLQPGNIIMLHDTCPPQYGMQEYWQNELAELFKNLTANYNVLPLAEVIKQPVMTYLKM